MRKIATVRTAASIKDTPLEAATAVTDLLSKYGINGSETLTQDVSAAVEKYLKSTGILEGPGA